MIPVIVISSLVIVKKKQASNELLKQLEAMGRDNISQIAQDIWDRCNDTADLIKETNKAVSPANGKYPEKEYASDARYLKLRNGIGKTKVGKAGYVYVLGGKGDHAGRYVISKNGERDGEKIWEAKDADGRLFIQSIVNKGLALRDQTVDFERYPWMNKGENTARMKIAAISYYEPWDWVIGVGVYEDDLFSACNTAESTLMSLLIVSLIGGAVIAVVTIIVAFVLSGKISGPLGRMINTLKDTAEQVDRASGQVSEASQSLAQGASEQAATIEESSSNMEVLAAVTAKSAASARSTYDLASRSSQLMDKTAENANEMNNSMRQIKEASGHTSKIIKTIDEIAFQTNLLALNAAVEAARAGEAGKGFAVVAEEVRNLAMRSAEAAKNTSSLIEETLTRVDNGVNVLDNLKSSLDQVAGSSGKMLSFVVEIAEATDNQAKGLDAINSTISTLSQVTQNNAANAEEGAAAAEELASQAHCVSASVNELSALLYGRVK